MTGGLEGGKNKNQDSAFCVKRWAGGWKLEGLLWTCAMDPETMYRPGVQEKTGRLGKSEPRAAALDPYAGARKASVRRAQKPVPMGNTASLKSKAGWCSGLIAVSARVPIRK